MQLLVTQLQNQDPMNPLQPYELAAQLAQFTSVQELVQLNTQFGTQATAINNNTQAVEAGLATGLVGRQVVTIGNEVDVSSSAAQTKILADVGGAGGHAVVSLTNAQGQAAGTYDLGVVPGGRQALSLNTSGLATGPYSYSLSVTSSSGASVPVTTYTAGIVTSVDLSTATPTLNLGDLSAPISSLIEVLPAPTSSSSTTTQ